MLVKVLCRKDTRVIFVSMPDKPQISAFEALSSLLDKKLDLHKLDEAHDLLRLIGIVVGQIALLDTVTSKSADPRAKVAAAKILTSTKERPEAIAERLRRSPLADLSFDELSVIIERVKQGDTFDLQQILAEIKAKEGQYATKKDLADGVGTGEGNAFPGRGSAG